MARTPLAARLEDIALSRRQFLAAGAATVAAGAWAPRARAAAAPRVVVVGAGLAGLTCAYRLSQAGVMACVHEASDRLGGRCWSIQGAFAPGLVAEHGGELIDTAHVETRQLCHELGLTTDDLLRGETNGTEPLYYFDGRPYTDAEAAEDFNGVYQKLHMDVSAASYPTTYRVSTQRGRELDAMTIVDWIEESVPGGIASRFGQLLDVAYNIEFGAECSEQSALNLVYLLGYIGQGRLRLFGKSDEKHHVRGGNDQITSAMGEALEGQIRMGSELVAIRRNATGTYALTFVEGGTTKPVTADRVVLALPFSIMRRSVDWSRAGFGPEKSRAIRELGMGTNSKLNVGFRTRYWRTLGCNGDTYADTGFQNTWEVSRGQPGKAGILVDYTGGRIGDSFRSGTPSTRTRQFLAQLEPLLPGVSAQWDGNATVDHWPSYPWTRGSYSYYKPGQYTAFGAAEEEVSGACHFAGEHTTQDFQGYLQGAVFSGERAATEVLDAI
jgi:monoamine oxidase